MILYFTCAQNLNRTHRTALIFKSPCAGTEDDMKKSNQWLSDSEEKYNIEKAYERMWLTFKLFL